MIELRSLQLFIRVCEEGSFSAAGRVEGIAQSVVSRHVARLEEEVGAKLLHRTTRNVEPTEAGRSFLASARQVLLHLEQARSELADSEERPTGLVRLTAPVTLGRRYVVPAVLRFMCEHPGVRVDIVLADRFTDFVADRIDLAIRLGALDDSTLKCRRLGRSTLAVVAAAAYLDEHGPISSVADLSRLHPIMLRSGGRLNRGWRSSDGQGVTGGEPRLVVDDLEAARDAVVKGLGVTVLPTWLIEDELRSGQLRRLENLPGPNPVPVWLVHRETLAPRMRVLVEFLVSELRLPIGERADA